MTRPRITSPDLSVNIFRNLRQSASACQRTTLATAPQHRKTALPVYLPIAYRRAMALLMREFMAPRHCTCGRTEVPVGVRVRDSCDTPAAD